MDWVALASVITSGLVAISSFLVPAITDRVKWKREREAARADSIDKVTVDLLRYLSFLRANQPHVAAQTMSPQEVYSGLLNSYFAWEHTLWSSWNRAQRESAKEMRTQLESAGPHDLRAKLSEIADEVLNLARVAD